jgi:hypothetical protein
MLRASSSEMGMRTTVPLRVPVALFGYSDAIGFGKSCVWHTSCAGSCATTLRSVKYEELAHRIARISTKLKTK